MPEDAHAYTQSHDSVSQQNLPPVCVRKRPLHNCSVPSLTPLMAPQFVEEVSLSVCNNRRGKAPRSIHPACGTKKKKKKRQLVYSG